MKKKILLLCLCLIGAVAFTFAGCDSCGNDRVSKYVKSMRSSADRAVTVNAVVTVTDNGVTVYTLTRNIEVDLETRTASVSDTKVTLSENFETATSSTTVPAEKVNGNSLIGIKLTKKLVSSYEITDGDLTAVVAQKKIPEVLSREVSASSDMTLSVDFENGNLVEASYSYINASSRTVSVTVTYGY